MNTIKEAVTFEDVNSVRNRSPFHQPAMSRDEQFDTSDEPKMFGKIFEMVFFFLLYLSMMLASYFILRGFTSANARRFNPLSWYLPIIVAIGCGNAAAFAWHVFVRYNPARALKIVFWLSPLMTGAAGVMLLAMESAWSLGIGILVIVLGSVQVLQCCWVCRRLGNTMEILSVATAVIPDYTTGIFLVVLALTTFYSATLGFAIAGSAAIGSVWDVMAIIFFVLSLLWILNTVENMMQTTVARIKHWNFAGNYGIPGQPAICDTIRYLIGSVALGTTVVPLITLLRWSARAMQFVSRGLLLCADHVAATLPNLGNRYGFVYTGVYNRGFKQASRDAWQLFERSEINPLDESDLTGLFRFFIDMTGGAASALVVGCGMRAIVQDHVPQVTTFALLIGYLIGRIGSAWAQASVSAYYITYAENPKTSEFEPPIHAHLQ